MQNLLYDVVIIQKNLQRDDEPDFIVLNQGKKMMIWQLFVFKHTSRLASTSKPEARKLSPTARAAYFHGLRVHLQIMQWLTLDVFCMEASHWGWLFENNAYSLIMTDEDSAPKDLLNIIRCQCKESSNFCGKVHVYAVSMA